MKRKIGHDYHDYDDYGENVHLANFAADSVESLCDNPVINAADRMVNGTVRLYRGNYYWDLLGMPDSVGVLTKPKIIQVPNLAPVGPKTSVMSCLVCNRKGYLYKYEGPKWWAWMPSGQPWKGGEAGRKFTLNNQGFDVVYHNGKPDEPLMIGINGRRMFYFSTKGYYFTPAPGYNPKGYLEGKNGENFPDGIDAAFTWPPLREEQGYFIYIFKGDKYCMRTEALKSGHECEEWLESKELFGCYKRGKK